MRSFSVVLSLVAVIVGSALVSGQQSLLVSQGQVLAFSGANNTPAGDLVPGLVMGERFGGNAGPDGSVIDDAGRAFFRAQIVDVNGVAFPTAQAYLGRGYFYGDSRGNLVKVLRGGDAEPSGTIPGATLQTSTGGVPFTGSPRISGNGQILFGASIWDTVGSTVTAANDTVLYSGTPGNWSIVAREGDAAPGCGGATYSTAFSGMSQQPTGINNAGQVFFQSSLTGTGVVTANNAAWFTGTPGNIQLMLRKGDITPGGEVVSALGFISQMNASGQIVTEVTFLAGSGTNPVTTANDKALWLYTPGLGITQLIREGDATPIPGTFYATAASTWSPNSASTTFNAAGQVMISTDLTGAVTAGVNDRAIILVSATNQSVVMRRGDPAPGIPGANLDTMNFSNQVFVDSGKIVIAGSVVGGGVTTADDSGVWAGTPGNLVLVAREGQVAPGSGGQTFGQFGSQFIIMNGAGQVFITNTLSGGATSFWVWDSILGLQSLMLNTDSIEVQPGLFKNPFTTGGVQFNNGDARPLSFANDGTLTCRVGFVDNTSAIMNVRIGSLTGIPAKIAEPAGGTHKLYLNAGAGNAGRVYVVAGSASGTAPGTQIGPWVVPLNVDFYTDFTLQNANLPPFVNTFSVLDVDGRAQAQVVIPPSLIGIIGIVVHHAYGVLDGSNNLVYASEAARLEIIP